MPHIQFSAEHRRRVDEAHRLWSNGLPRSQGQIGGTITAIVEGPPIYVTGEVTAYSDFEPVRYLVNADFVDFLRTTNIPFREN
jgi:hypothetical protein